MAGSRGVRRTLMSAARVDSQWAPKPRLTDAAHEILGEGLGQNLPASLDEAAQIQR